MSDKPRCPNHKPEPQLGYLSWHADAERRGRAGEHQWKCGACGLWIWEEYMIDFKGAERDDFHTRRLKREEREAKKRKAETNDTTDAPGSGSVYRWYFCPRCKVWTIGKCLREGEPMRPAATSQRR